MNATARAAVGCLSANRARRTVAAAAGLPRWQATSLLTRRGHCRAPGCASRIGVIRVTVDTTMRDAVERFAHVECAQCGRVWYRVRGDIAVVDAHSYPRVLFTLIAPSGQSRVLYRVRANGAWRAAGDDQLVIANATLGQVQDAVAVWRKAWDRREAAKARAKARKAERDAAAYRELEAKLAAAAARRAEREAAERAAAEREAAGEA